MLKSCGSEITLQNKVIDLAVFGHLVTTLELLQLAVERNGVLGSLGKIRTLLSVAKVGSHILFTERKEWQLLKTLIINRTMVYICLKERMRVSCWYSSIHILNNTDLNLYMFQWSIIVQHVISLHSLYINTQCLELHPTSWVCKEPINRGLKKRYYFQISFLFFLFFTIVL